MLRAMSITMTLAAAPNIVPLPPRHAPRARDHHKADWIVAGSKLVSASMVLIIVCTIGISAVTTGIFPIIAEAIAENHIIIIEVRSRSLRVKDMEN